MRMPSVALGEHSRVAFRRLSHKEDEDRRGSFFVGAKGGADYVEVSAEGMGIIRMLSSGRTVGETEAHYPHYDVRGFVSFLARNGLVESADGRALEEREKRDYIEIGSKIPFLDARTARALASPVAGAVYAGVIFAGLALLATSAVVVRYEDFLFDDSLALVLLVSFAFSWLLVLLHELGHYIAGLALGAKPELGLTNRLYYLIAFTDLSDLYLASRRDRLKAYVGGILMDLLAVSLCAIALWALAPPLFAAKLLKFVILVELISVLWQALFFLRTDFYYIIENALRVDNLHDETKRFLRHLARTRFRTSGFESEVPRRELWAYAFFLVFGTIVNLLAFALVQLPITFLMLAKSSIGLSARGSPLFFDSLVFILVFFINIVFLARSFWASGSLKGVWHAVFAFKALLHPPLQMTWKHHVTRKFARRRRF